MKKIMTYIIAAIMIMAAFMVVYDTFLYNDKNKEACLNEDLAAIKAMEQEGMRVLMIGGSNTDYNISEISMGYFIRTKNDEVIIIDGGLEFDYDEIKLLADSYADGIIDHWILTNASKEHSGALAKFLTEDNRLTIKNLHYKLMEESWYKKYDKAGYNEEKKLLDSIASTDKVLNYNVFTEDFSLESDNIKFEVLKVPNGSEKNIKDTSVVIKLTAQDVDKSMIFLSDYIKDDIKDLGKKLEADAVQLANHGDGGSKEVYELIKPKVAFYNSPLWLYLNQSKDGTQKLNYKTEVVNEWLEELKIEETYLAGDCNQLVHFQKDNIKSK